METEREWVKKNPEKSKQPLPSGMNYRARRQLENDHNLEVLEQLTRLIPQSNYIAKEHVDQLSGNIAESTRDPGNLAKL